MNPELAVTNASASHQIQNPKSKIANVIGVSSGHKRNGKIARLPKAVRDKINQFIDDGRTYPQIIKDLGDDAIDLKPGHFSEWRKGGYQDYLRHQDWRDQLRILRENGSDMSELTDGPKFQETLVQIALTEIFRVLQQGELKPDSLNYIRLFNALARLNREALGLRKYNDLLAKEQADLKQLDPKRKISENEQLAIVDTIDHIMEMPRPGSAARAASSVSSHGAPASAGPVSSSPSPEPTSEPCSSRREEALSPPIENSPCPPSPSTPSSPLPSRPCRADVSPSPWGEGWGEGDRSTRQTDAQCEKRHAQTPSEMGPPIENQSGRTMLVAKIENCLDCGSPLPPVPPHSLRRPDDHCPSCGMRLPNIGLCYQPGFDRCLNCGATQPALLPGGERPRPYCHKCGERLHNPELPAS